MDFDLTNLPPGFIDDPHPHYAALRVGAPVHELPTGGLFLSRHADLLRVYKDRAVFSSDKKIEFRPKFGDSLLYQHHTTSLVFNDAPLHTRVRRAIAGALSPRAIAGMDSVVKDLVDGLIIDLEARHGAGATVDAVAHFAQNIPIEVIGNLLAIPRHERGPLRDWSLAILGALEPEISAAQFDLGETAVREFLAYLDALVARRRAEGTVVQMREMRSQGKGRVHGGAKRGGGLELHDIHYTPDSQRRHPSFDLAEPSSYNRLNKNNAGAPPNAGLWKGLGQ